MNGGKFMLQVGMVKVGLATPLPPTNMQMISAPTCVLLKSMCLFFTTNQTPLPPVMVRLHLAPNAN